MKKNITLIGASLLVTCAVHADLQLPNIFNHDMVLQQAQAVPVWGTAAPGKTITVKFGQHQKSTTVSDDGTWKLHLAALTATATPAEFNVSGDGTVTFTNVVVGEVWFCSGQSNMEWTMNRTDNAKDECAAAENSLIRHFKVPKRVAILPQSNINAKWELTTPKTIPHQSAVAYFFGRRLHEILQVPIGLVHASWGGTRIEPWTPACGFNDFPNLQNIKKQVAFTDAGTPVYQQRLAEHIAALEGWLQEAKAAHTAKNAVQQATPAFPQELIANQKPNQQHPTVLFNGMMAGLVPFAIKGAIWYQGCSNVGEGMLYLEKTQALVKGWREVWQQGDFPYYLVQLAPYNYGGNRAHHLPEIWEAQALVPTKIPNSGYTVINDIGNTRDIHPRNKQDVGLRLANQALNRTYQKDMAWSGPVYDSFTVEENKLRVKFQQAQGLTTRDGKAPNWFEVMGADKVYRPAQAVIEGESVLLTTEEGGRPLAVRFAWSQLAEPNLVNGEGLPAGAFRSQGNTKMDEALNIPELQGFRKLYEIDLPIACNFAQQSPQYTLDQSAQAGDFKRVAYVLQLEQANHVTYACTLMDAFTGDAKQLAIPHLGSGIKHQTKVQNLVLRSNAPGVPDLEEADGANIEFWGNNYSAANHLQLPQANAKRYDFDDTPSADGTYGCMQVHAWKHGLTIWAFNNFNHGAACDIGIGNNTQGENPDYTFMKNGGSYQRRRLTILVQ